MRTETAGQRIARGTLGAVDLVGSLVNRAMIVRKDRTDAREREVARRAGPTVQERQDDLVHFYNRFEDLVEVLCDAAQYGPTPHLERVYGECRSWVHGHYHRVRPFLLAYLRPTAEDEHVGGDAFLALVSTPDLKTFLDHDDGGMISRITRTREALNLYGEHLRQLASKTAA